MADGSRLLVDGAVVASVAAAALLLPAALRGAPGPGRRDAGAGRRSVARWLCPEVALLAVTGLIYVNQVLCTVYVLRVHDGDPSFVARYLGPGWFELADGNAGLRWFAAHFPAPELLAPSVLRVQAVLELPFVLLAVLAALRWLDPALYRRAAGSPLLWAASASYTFVFCVVEWELRNPYTVDDIALRCVSALVTPPLLAALARVDRRRPVRRPSAGGLLLYLGSLATLGLLVLVVYDTALLYNLGRADERAPGAALALTVLAVCRRAAARQERPAARPGGAVAFVGHGVWWFLALFWVPALAVRYGVTFGTPALAAGAGVALLLAAVVLALRDVRRESAESGRPVRWPRLAAGLGGAGAAGTAAAYAAALPLDHLFYEAALFAGAMAFLVTALAVCAAGDRFVVRAEVPPPT